jgi:hypothetical protein
MKRIKSAPANIAEMVNRKKPINIDNSKDNDKKILCFIPFKKQNEPLIVREKINPIKNQKNVEKTFNNLMLDYINDKQILNINDEQSVIASILYYYVSEKIFTKNNLREFILFIMQIILRYIITHTMHETIIYNKELINLVNDNILLISNTFH